MLDTNANIVVTGAAGFIGSCLVSYLNQLGYHQLILVDEFSRADKNPNLEDKRFIIQVEREVFFSWFYKHRPPVGYVFHLGAKTDTTEFNYAVHQHLNVDYSQDIWQLCATLQIPLIYASSAATYGSGESGYKDDHELAYTLRPLNPYGISKNEFDKWALQQKDSPPFWAGLKFFNVYGPNEYHKGRMASVVFHSFNQIRSAGTVKLFKSHRPDYKDGEQLRDFVYVKDVLNVCYWLMVNQPASGIYNLGTGKARSFKDLVRSAYAGLDAKPDIQYIDMPEDIREKYQYFTEADMNKLRHAGYDDAFYSLENGVEDYVRNYLSQNRYY
ncbi:MAG: ADP-glyceromanno-heptose 6-epimerase [Chitinophagaceae bacterium]